VAAQKRCTRGERKVAWIAAGSSGTAGSNGSGQSGSNGTSSANEAVLPGLSLGLGSLPTALDPFSCVTP
jgi:hypothetical protein